MTEKRPSIPYRELMPDIAHEQLAAIRSLHEAFDAARIEYWLFGGWAVDFHIGSVTREHSDLDVAIWLRDQPRVAALLSAGDWRHEETGDGYVAWSRGPVRGEFAVLERDETGVVYTPTSTGRASWPQDAFGQDVGVIEDVRAHVIASAALIEEKSAGYGDSRAHEKDRADVAALRRHLAQRNPRA